MMQILLLNGRLRCQLARQRRWLRALAPFLSNRTPLISFPQRRHPNGACEMGGKGEIRLHRIAYRFYCSVETSYVNCSCAITALLPSYRLFPSIPFLPLSPNKNNEIYSAYIQSKQKGHLARFTHALQKHSTVDVCMIFL